MNAFKWEHRLIVVFLPESNLPQTVRLLEAARDELDDRDVLWFCLTGGERVRTNFEGKLESRLIQELAKHRQDSQTTEEVVLIGKDGGVKYRSQSMKLQVIFERIDSMPMRRAEMKRNQDSERSRE